MITCIAKLKEGFTIADAATEVKAAFGMGGNPEAPIIEEYIGFVNTPVVGGYFRASFAEAYAAALDYLKGTGETTTVDILSVEWQGQEVFPLPDGIDGEVLGYIAGINLKPEE